MLRFCSKYTTIELMSQTSLESNEIAGLIKLLHDSEEKTLQLIAEQISSFDHLSLNQLNELAHKSENESLVDNWYHVSRMSIESALKAWKKKPDLEEGMFILARLETPGIDKSKIKAALDKYASRVSELLTIDSSETEIIKAMNQVLFEEENLSGNQIFYYDLNNNFINTVLDSKAGNPITLCSIYILIGRRLNLDIQGLGTPGHFIVKHGDTLLDPFFQGREITKDECMIRAQELGVFWRDEYLQPIDDLAIIARSLRNLIAIYKKNKDYRKSSDVAELSEILD